VTGYLIGDDSTLAKPTGKKMEGVGHHDSSTAAARVRGLYWLPCASVHRNSKD